MANIKMYQKWLGEQAWRKMCQCAYFAVPFDMNDYDSKCAIFSDEQAADMFAQSISSYVITDYASVTIK